MIESDAVVARTLSAIPVRASRQMTHTEYQVRVAEVLNLFDIEATGDETGIRYGDEGVELEDQPLEAAVRILIGRRFGIPEADGAGNDAPQSSHRFLTVEQVAEQLNVGVPLVRAPVRTGELRGFQVGGRGLWRIGSVDLEDYISQAYLKTAQRIEAGDLADEAP